MHVIDVVPGGCELNLELNLPRCATLGNGWMPTLRGLIQLVAACPNGRATIGTVSSMQVEQFFIAVVSRIGCGVSKTP